MIPGSSNPLMMAAAPAGDYQIERSLRFNSSDSGFCSRTPAVAGNRRTWTWSGWIKRGRTTSLGEMFFAAQPLYICFTGSNATGTSPDRIALSNVAVNSVNIETAAVFRDFSAWFHLVVALDTTQTTSSDRVKIYVNGQLAAISYAVYPSLSEELSINSTLPHGIGRSFVGAGNDWDIFSGYLADIHFIDGQALTPSSFTEVSATTGQLIPKAYSGTFGTNGFWLKFSDNSAATAATLGKDYSGNSNNWTPNNLSVTAGAGNDSLVDTPTSYGTDTGVGNEVRGNYATWNPLQSSAATLTNGNLDCTTATATGGQVRATIAVSSGKWYWEVTVNTTVSANNIGIIKTSEALAADEPGYFAGGYSYGGSTGNKRNNASASAYGATYGSGDVIGVALDLTAGTLVFYKNGASQGTAFSSLTGEFIPCVGDGTGSNGLDMTTNFGQRAFAYQTPGTNRPAATYKALCDTNLGAPLVAKPNTLMDVKLWTGTGATQSITGVGFNPDFLWIKSRSGSGYNHHVYDSVRGIDKFLRTNTTQSEFTVSPLDQVTSLNADGFTLGSDSASPGALEVNELNQTYVGWLWDAGTTTASNPDGSITSQVRANVSAGFSIVTYTGQTAAGTIGHGLGVAPSLIICKSRSNTQSWGVYHKDTGINNYLLLDSTGASTAYSGIWGSSAPTSTVFGVPGNVGLNNNNTWTYVAYCFAPVVGYTSAGSYTGNGSADGPFVYTSMRPRWILLKRTDSTGNWTILDTAREGYNVDNDPLFPNLADAEGTADLADILSNGFKLRSTDASVNASGGTYIYYAISETAFQYSRAR